MRSTVPEASPSDELRSYPRDLLDSPRGDIQAEFTAAPGAASAAAGTAAAPTAGDGLTARLEGLSRHLTALAGAQRLTLPVGLLAVLLAVVLGAGHALLPGHGKTVMAAYLAGRRGGTRDAVTVGATVTLTHTAGVLIVGLCLTAFSSLAGDTVLAWLGVVSGALVALVGAGLLTDAVRRARRRPRGAAGDTGAARTADQARRPALVGSVAHAHHDHDHPQHDHAHEHPHPAHDHATPHRHGLFGHHHSHGPEAADAARAEPFTTRGLVGLGIAGGLVPSPSALVVLLGAIALGRTVFGGALVVAYGLGMAATLTAVGLLLVRLGDRLAGFADRPLFALLRRIAPHTAALTALLVLVVGLGLMVRSLPPLL